MTRNTSSDSPAGEATPADGVGGRPYVVGAGLTVTAFAAVAGSVLGSNSPAETVRLAGVFTLPVSAWTLAAYGGVLAGGIVSTLFGLVSLASRFDDAAVE